MHPVQGKTPDSKDRKGKKRNKPSSKRPKRERRKARMFSRQTGKGILMVAATAAWAWGAAAQQPGSSPQSSPSQQQQMPGQQGSPGAAAPSPGTGMPDTSQTGPSNYADQTFVHDTIEGDNAQVAMSQLAVQKSSSPDVKQFGQKMVQIHTELNNQMEPAAKELSMSAPKGPSKKQQKEIDHLQALNGPDFDTAYIQAMARQQQHDLKGFKGEAQGGQTANIKQAAQQDEPVLEQHYQVLEKLAQAHNVTLESKK
jgi:putative membrane protein